MAGAEEAVLRLGLASVHVSKGGSQAARESRLLDVSRTTVFSDLVW